MNSELDKPVTYLKGVGPKRAEIFRKIGVETVYDLLCCYPRDYLDLTVTTPISDAVINEQAVLKAAIVKKLPEARIRKDLSVFKAVATDGTADITIVIYNSGYSFAQLKLEFCRDGMHQLLSIGMKSLLCVGETAQMRKDGSAKDVIAQQVSTGLSKVPADAAYRIGIMYRQMWEFEGERTDLNYALEMIEVIKQASFKALPDLPEPLPVFYGGDINVGQLSELFDKQVIDGVYVDGKRMSPEKFVEMIDTIGA